MSEERDLNSRGSRHSPVFDAKGSFFYQPAPPPPDALKTSAYPDPRPSDALHRTTQPAPRPPETEYHVQQLPRVVHSTIDSAPRPDGALTSTAHPMRHPPVGHQSTAYPATVEAFYGYDENVICKLQARKLHCTLLSIRMSSFYRKLHVLTFKAK